MAQQNTLFHIPQKMRRIVRDTNVTITGVESRFECPACNISAWRPISVQRFYLCNGMSVAVVLPMATKAQHPPSAEEIIDTLREALRYNLHPRFRLRLIDLVRRLRSPK